MAEFLIRELPLQAAMQQAGGRAWMTGVDEPGALCLLCVRTIERLRDARGWLDTLAWCDRSDRVAAQGGEARAALARWGSVEPGDVSLGSCLGSDARAVASIRRRKRLIGLTGRGIELTIQDEPCWI